MHTLIDGRPRHQTHLQSEMVASNVGQIVFDVLRKQLRNVVKESND
jgi:hypothetical protein